MFQLKTYQTVTPNPNPSLYIMIDFYIELHGTTVQIATPKEPIINIH